MSHSGKMNRSSKYVKSGKYTAQFRRTVRRNGKWRGKKDYVKYQKKKVKRQEQTTEEWYRELGKKYGNGRRISLLHLALIEFIRKI